MGRHIVCPGCGEAEELMGSQSPEGIRIRCEKCETEWLRDAEPERCATCGGTEVVQRQRALTQFSRGSQLSIVGFTAVPLCRVCDAEMLAWAHAGRAVPFNYRPAALDPEAAKEREKQDGDDVIITP